MRQDGRSASLTAPNGSAQRRLLVAAMAVAGLEACGGGRRGGARHGHGAGRPDGGGLAGGRVLRRARVGAGGGRGEGEHRARGGGVGQAGLCEVASSCSRLGVAGNTQLRVLNPLVRERLGAGGTAALPSQPLASAGGACGLSSFGYSGTIAHLLFSAPSQVVPPSRTPAATPSRLVLKQRTYAWGNKLRKATEAGHVVRVKVRVS